MQGSLGAKIAEGATADIHAWAPGQAVKLFKPDVPREVGAYEARMTRAVFAAGAPAPEVFDEVTLDGRFGIVLSRFDGPTLLELTRSGGVTYEQAGAILASLCRSVHQMQPPPGVISLRAWTKLALKSSGSVVPKHVATGILARVDHLPPGHGLCHGDLHPGNVIMTPHGPRLIDWTNATRAPAAFDLSWLHVGLTELAMEISDNPQRPLAVNAAAQAEYARLAGMSEAALSQAVEHLLPIVVIILFIFFGGPTSARWQRLMQRVEAALHPPDSRDETATNSRQADV